MTAPRKRAVVARLSEAQAAELDRLIPELRRAECTPREIADFKAAFAALHGRAPRPPRTMRVYDRLGAALVAGKPAAALVAVRELSALVEGVAKPAPKPRAAVQRRRDPNARHHWWLPLDV